MKKIEVYGTGRVGGNISLRSLIAPPGGKSAGGYPRMYFMDDVTIEKIANMPKGKAVQLLSSKGFYGDLFEANMRMIAEEVRSQIDGRSQYRLLTLPSLGNDLSFMGAMFKTYRTGTGKEVCFLKRKKDDVEIICVFPSDEVREKARISSVLEEVSTEEAVGFIYNAVLGSACSKILDQIEEVAESLV